GCSASASRPGPCRCRGCRRRGRRRESLSARFVPWRKVSFGLRRCSIATRPGSAIATPAKKVGGGHCRPRSEPEDRNLEGDFERDPEEPRVVAKQGLQVVRVVRARGRRLAGRSATDLVTRLDAGLSVEGARGIRHEASGEIEERVV